MHLIGFHYKNISQCGALNVKFVVCLKQWLGLLEGPLMTYEKTQTILQEANGIQRHVPLFEL